MRHATRFNKRDAVETEILAALDKLGVFYVIAPPLDLWCYLGTRWVPVEEKSGNAPLTKGQQEFMAACIETGRPCVVWRSAAEAVESVQSWRQRA